MSFDVCMKMCNDSDNQDTEELSHLPEFHHVYIFIKRSLTSLPTTTDLFSDFIPVYFALFFGPAVWQESKFLDQGLNLGAVVSQSPKTTRLPVVTF